MPVETILYTIRHGHTEYNSQRRYAGSIDIPLSEKGIRECRQAALRLADSGIDVAVTSAMTRCIESARLLLGGKDVPIIHTALCNERGFGIMEGHTWEDVLKFEPPILMIEVGNELHTVNPEGGEPFEDVWARAKKFRWFFFKNFTGKRVLVVSHGVFLQMLHGVLRGMSCIEALARFPSNLELAQFRFVDNRLTHDKVEKLIKIESEVCF